MASEPQNQTVINKDLVQQFKEICDVDDETACTLLRESGWSLESAIHQYFYEAQSSESIENLTNEEQELRYRHNTATSSSSGSSNNLQIQHRKSPQTWFQWIRAVVFLPFNFVYSTLTEFTGFIFRLLFRPTVVNRLPRQASQHAVETRQLMREQELEYEHSLALDRQKKQKQDKLEQDNKADAEFRLNNERKQMEKQQKLCEIRKKILEEMPSEPSTGDGINCVKIRVSFPDGSKFDRLFKLDDSLEALFNAVFVHKQCPDNFSLFLNYPKRILNCAPEWYRQFIDHIDDNFSIRTFQEEGLTQSSGVVVFVQNDDA